MDYTFTFYFDSGIQQDKNAQATRPENCTGGHFNIGAWSVVSGIDDQGRGFLTAKGEAECLRCIANDIGATQEEKDALEALLAS